MPNHHVDPAFLLRLSFVHDWTWAIDTAWLEESTVGETPELIPSVSSQGPTPNSDGGVDAPVVPAAGPPIIKESPTVDIGVTESFEWWGAVGIPEGRYYNDDSEWKWDGEMKTNGDWPITYPSVSATGAS